MSGAGLKNRSALNCREWTRAAIRPANGEGLEALDVKDSFDVTQTSICESEQDETHDEIGRREYDCLQHALDTYGESDEALDDVREDELG